MKTEAGGEGGAHTPHLSLKQTRRVGGEDGVSIQVDLQLLHSSLFQPTLMSERRHIVQVALSAQRPRGWCHRGG